MKNVRIYIENGPKLEAKTNSKKDFVTSGELVFTTSMTGYQEIITDPSYASQIVVATYPLIGNYGTNQNWNQSAKVWAKGMIVQSIDNDNGFEKFLSQQNIPIIHSIDTRNLTHLIRESFYPKCVVSTKDMNKLELNKYFKEVNPNIVHKISTKTPKFIEGKAENGQKICILDFGVKQGIIEQLRQYFSKIAILPYNSNLDTILSTNPNCVLLSNGPGDPAVLKDVIINIKNMLGKIDIYGICLGHQLLALALDCKTQIMKFGHRGANHPVINVDTGKIIITSQNHGYEIVQNSLPSDLKITHRNVHDNSIEGISSIKYNAKSVQFHPESSPGPEDGRIIFKEWFNQ